MDSNSDISSNVFENNITIDFVANQDITNIHFEDSYNCKSPSTNPVMHYHLGQDSSGHNSSLGIISDFRDTTILNTPSSGKRTIFIVGSSNILMDSKITNHVSLDIEGLITFIQFSQLFCTKYSCWCNVVVFRPMECQSWNPCLEFFKSNLIV